MLLAQAEQAAHDLAQAEADLRASSVISPIVSGKRAIVALGAISIVGLIIASHDGKGPATVTPQQVQPLPIMQGAVSSVPPFRPTFPPHMEKDASRDLRPKDGYDWSDRNHVSVRWMPGKDSREYPHVIASGTEGEWQPDDGYGWADLTKPKDNSVRWMPGIASDRYANVVAAAVEGQWRPADGYAWVLNPPRPGDMRVKPVPRPEEQNSLPISENPFQRGLMDRTELEQWVAAQSADFRQGAEWWAGRRSLPNPGSCNGPAATSQDFVFGCEAAKTRLTPIDIMRKSDPEYRRGWNSYTGQIKPPSALDVRGSPVEQSTTGTPRDSETEPADRLNAQELKRLRGQ